MEQYTKFMKEYKNLTPVVEKYREYKGLETDIADAEMILSEETDPELRALAEEQKDDARSKLEPTMDELKILLLPKDPTTIKTLLSRSAAAQAAKKRRFFRRCSTVCIPCMPNPQALRLNF